MSNLIEFLTSKEIIVVYIVAAIACFLCFIIYIIDKNYYKRKQRHNTKELNKLVEDVNVRLEEATTSTIEQAAEQEENVPVLESIIVEDINTPEVLEKEKLSKSTIEEQKEEKPAEKVEDIILETMAPEPENHVTKEELMYTDVEPNKEEAQLELQRLTEELEKAEQETKNIDLTAYEEEQEENAIISLEELVRKSKEMYAANELTQYEDEGNEPISLQDLELRIKQAEQDEPVIIKQITEEIKEPLLIQPHQERMVLDDFNNIKLEEPPAESPKPAYQTTKKFHSSPVISPIYGIEKKDSSTDIELENTANYEKLDEEIKKTNEFLMTLRELQKHLD